MASRRSGVPITGVTERSGADNSLTNPRVITFANPLQTCIVTHHGVNDELLIKINTQLPGITTLTEDFSQGTGLGHFVIPPKNTDFLADTSDGPPTGSANHVDVSLGGMVLIHSVTFATTNASDDLDDVSVVGW